LIVSFAFILFASGAVFLSVGDQSISGEPDKKQTQPKLSKTEIGPRKRFLGCCVLVVVGRFLL
jgi:hypothetical protein